MNLTITLPEKIAAQIQRKAEERHLSAEEIAVDLLQDALDHERELQDTLLNGYEPIGDEDDDFPSPEEVVAQIKALGPTDPRYIRPATGSLAEALRNKPYDPDFDFDEWNRQWAEFEAELKAITRANDIAEGRI
ncbi:MAG: hypothetical protein U0350_28970 [Caldilineaceae bacterium]